MKKTVLLDRGAERQVENEERYLFTRSILEHENLSLPLEDCFPETYDLKDFTVAHKAKLRDVLMKFGISIIEEIGGDTIIEIDGNEIARWKKPFFELRSDSARRAPPHVVLYLETSSAFDSEEKEK